VTKCLDHLVQRQETESLKEKKATSGRCDLILELVERGKERERVSSAKGRREPKVGGSLVTFEAI